MKFRPLMLSAFVPAPLVDGAPAAPAQARAYGIQGVPFFVIDGQYGISGAQPPAAFENVLRDLWSKRGDAELEGDAEAEAAAV